MGGLAEHLAYFSEAQKEAQYLGRKIGEAALRDAQEGPQKWRDAECRAYYTRNSPFSPLEPYFENLMGNEMRPETPVIARSLASGLFENTNVLNHLRIAQEELNQALTSYRRVTLMAHAPGLYR